MSAELHLDEVDTRDLDEARRIFARHNIAPVFLFGSMAKGNYDEHSDWDFACHGIAAEDYLELFGELYDTLRRRVDLVDLDRSGRFAKHLEASGDFLRIA
jgi:predicted nucleotidyltransferase